MAGSRTPWAIIVATAVSALVAGGALLAANRLGDRSAPASRTSAPVTSEVGVDGCLVRPCCRPLVAGAVRPSWHWP